VAYSEVLALAAAGEPAAVATVEASGRALGQLIALIANTTQVDKIVLSGDGVALADTAAEAMAEGIAASRNRWASPVVVEVHHAGFDQWARGAAALAILQHVVGEDWNNGDH
jgi:predicted NBD/HSP70 family sugar kinase